jgi:GNAT superfamily N-acetyltransferase
MSDEVLNGLSVDGRTDMWRSVMESGDPSAALLVLDGADGVCGFAHVCAARDDDVAAGTGEVSAIYLVPSVWGLGGGRALMMAALDRLSDTGYTQAVLWVLTSNERARRFYEMGGWECDGAEKVESVGGAPIVETRYRRTLRTGDQTR